MGMYKMTMEQLFRKYKEHHPSGHFFDDDTLRFFGERRSEMRVLDGRAVIEDYAGEKHVCYILSARQWNCPAGPRRVHHYFDIKTYDVIEPCPRQKALLEIARKENGGNSNTRPD